MKDVHKSLEELTASLNDLDGRFKKLNKRYYSLQEYTKKVKYLLEGVMDEGGFVRKTLESEKTQDEQIRMLNRKLNMIIGGLIVVSALLPLVFKLLELM